MSGVPHRGEIWRARLGPITDAVGHEQAKERPVVVVSADFMNLSRADSCIVLPITTSLRAVRSHVRIDPPEGGLDEPSSIQCEQIRAVSRERLTTFVGTVDEDTMARIEYALRMILDLT